LDERARAAHGSGESDRIAAVDREGCAGGYRDRIVLDGESCRFAEKLVTFDTDRIDTLLVTPL
jgi:hypothetical protein